jgi:hypothetical protein
VEGRTAYSEYRFGPIRVRDEDKTYIDELRYLAKKERFSEFLKVAERLYPDLSEESLLAAYDFFLQGEPRLDGDELFFTQPVSMCDIWNLAPFLASIAQPRSIITVEVDGGPPVEWFVTKGGSLRRRIES